MKKLTISLILFLFGCAESDSETGRRFQCLNGVMYYYIDRGAAPAFNQNGTLRTCEYGSATKIRLIGEDDDNNK